MSIEDRIRALEDRDEIRELTARYCHAIVAGDADAVLALFTPDGEFKMGEREYRGLDELRQVYGAGVAAATPKPFIQNHVIELDGDRATGRCSVEIRLVQDGEAYTAAGHYFDRYRRVEGHWRFERRDFQPFHWVPLAKGWA